MEAFTTTFTDHDPVVAYLYPNGNAVCPLCVSQDDLKSSSPPRAIRESVMDEPMFCDSCGEIICQWFVGDEVAPTFPNEDWGYGTIIETRVGRVSEGTDGALKGEALKPYVVKRHSDGRIGYFHGDQLSA